MTNDRYIFFLVSRYVYLYIQLYIVFFFHSSCRSWCVNLINFDLGRATYWKIFSVYFFIHLNRKTVNNITVKAKKKARHLFGEKKKYLKCCFVIRYMLSGDDDKRKIICNTYAKIYMWHYNTIHRQRFCHFAAVGYHFILYDNTYLSIVDIKRKTHENIHIYRIHNINKT